MQFGENRRTQFRIIVVTDPTQTNTVTHPQIGPITIHCTAKLSVQYNNASNISVVTNTNVLQMSVISNR